MIQYYSRTTIQLQLYYDTTTAVLQQTYIRTAVLLLLRYAVISVAYVNFCPLLYFKQHYILN